MCLFFKQMIIKNRLSHFNTFFYKQKPNTMKKNNVPLSFFLFFFITGIFVHSLAAAHQDIDDAKAAYYEEQGINLPNVPELVFEHGQRTIADIPEEGLLLIPNSTANTVMAFDPYSGNLVDEFFFPPEPDHLSTPIMALWNHDQTSFLLSDQLRKLVQQFDTDGIFEQTFAPIGGEDQSILHNIRGIFMRSDGNLLVTVAGGANANSVAMFDTEGEYLGNFIDNNAGGLNSPWNIVFRPEFNDYLITASGSGSVHRFDTDGNPIGIFASGINFPQQLFMNDEGNILVATFSSPSGVYEFDSAGNQIGYYGVVTGLRGVYELGNGNLLVTNSSGVHEINRNNQFIETKISAGARHISMIMPPATGLFAVTFDITDEHENPVDDATVSLNGVTNEPGDYIFADLEPGVYSYVVSHDCYHETAGELEVVNANIQHALALEGVPGDANGDGSVNVLDVIAIVAYFVGTDTEGMVCFDNADVNGDGIINILDIIGTVAIYAEDDNDDTSTVIDVDGNVYQTVIIGENEWMAENLRVTHYRNGDPIPHVTDNAQWAGLSSGAYCVYENNSNYTATYGKLYNWYAVDDPRGLCPEGWRVPSDDEYFDLMQHLDAAGAINDNIAGGKMKDTGTTGEGDGLWSPPNTGATNESGFTALPGGARYSTGMFGGIHTLAQFWSATPTPSEILQRAWNWYMDSTTAILYRNNYSRVIGHSVRCIKD